MSDLTTLQADNEILERKLQACRNRIEDDCKSAEAQLRDIVSLRQQVKTLRRSFLIVCAATFALLFKLMSVTP